MRKRVDALGVAQPEIQRTGSDEIDVALPNVSNARRAEAQVGKTALLYFYDWEPNVIGPDGKPAPTEASVTGGANAGLLGTSGLPQYQAVLRAAKRPAIMRKNDTTLSPGCTPRTEGRLHLRAAGTCSTPSTKRCLRGPEETEAEPVRRDYKAPKGAKLEGGAREPRARCSCRRGRWKAPTARSRSASPNSWYVLNDDPVLTGVGHHEPAGELRKRIGHGADVTFGFTSHGKSVFQRVTKEIAQRGQEAQLPGVTKEEALQHFAIVLDGQLITAPSIDFTKYPEGIDASQGLGDLRRLHADLRARTSPTSCSPARCRSS